MMTAIFCAYVMHVYILFFSVGLMSYNFISKTNVCQLKMYVVDC